MAGVNITLNQQQIEEFRRQLESINKGFEKAANRSLNRTLTGSKALISKGIREKATLKAAFIKSTLRTQKSTQNLIGAKITIAYKKTPSVNYQHTVSKRKGVKLKIFKNAAPIALKHDFKRTMSSGHEGIFRRKFDPVRGRLVKRLPIQEEFSPAVTTLFENTPNLSQTVLESSAERLLDEMERQTAYILSQNS